MNTVRKAAAWFLCFSMLLSNTTVYAEDILSTPENNDFTLQEESVPETEGEILQQEEESQEDLPEENWGKIYRKKILKVKIICRMKQKKAVYL